MLEVLQVGVQEEKHCNSDWLERSPTPDQHVIRPRLVHVSWE